MKRADDSKLKFRKCRVLGEEVMMQKTAVGRMDADGKIKVGRHLPERVKIRGAERPFAFQAAHEDAAGAVFLGPLKLIPHHRRPFFEEPQRRLGDPAQTASALAPKIAHPAVVRFTKRALAFGILKD